MSLEHTMEVLLAYAYILPFWSKFFIHLSIIDWVAIYIYFCYTFYSVKIDNKISPSTYVARKKMHYSIF